MKEEKVKFLEEFSRCYGIVKTACERAGLTRQTYYKWMRDDEAFASSVRIVLDEQVDMVEGQLLDKIQEGDTTAVIFYLKCKGKGRGYGNVEVSEKRGQEADRRKPKADGRAMKRVGGVKSAIIRALKLAGKYSADMSYQVEATAQLIVRCEMLKQEIFDCEHDCVNVETSREGNVRESVSPRERLYLEYLKQCQYSLRALGMNTDSRVQMKGGSDGFEDFLSQFKEG